MTKKDYHEKVEEHRQEIELKNEPISRLSRSNRHMNKKTKKQRNPFNFVSLLLVVFIIIPLIILVYVWAFYEPVKVEEVKEDGIVQLEKNEPAESSDIKIDDEEKSEDSTQPTSEEQQLTEEIAAKEAAAAEEAQKLAIEKAKKEEELKKAEKAKQQEQAKQKEQEEAKKAQPNTHTVQSTDNLYRIALKYYNDGSSVSVNKIKQANNLSSDSISTGQVLIIPQ